jgi:hypothetical protein
VTAFAFDAGQASISRFASSADQVGQRATRFDGRGPARRDRMFEKSYIVSPGDAVVDS